MFSKVVCFAAVLVITAGQPLGHHQPAYSEQRVSRHDGHAEVIHVKDPHGHHSIDYYTHPKFEFEYKVEDHHTGDIKSQHEERDGDVVKGTYSLHQPDGIIREVHYTSSDHDGFRADVKFNTHHHKHHM